MSHDRMEEDALPERELASDISRRSVGPLPEPRLSTTPGPRTAAAIDPSPAANDRLAAFVGARSCLLRVARRIVGTQAEAEDVVQDAWLRWDSADRGQIRNPRAFLMTATRRLAINRIVSRSSGRQVCLGASPPDPVTREVDGTLGVEEREGVKLGLLLLTQRLSGAERAAYLLREVFDYEYAEIAAIIHVSEVNSRQLVVRGRKRLVEGRRAPSSWIARRRLLEAFTDAVQDGDLAPLEALLASDVSSARTRSARPPSTPSPSLAPSCASALAA
jgi:RNA polymerase sigma-70 factor (ECF subfamily)